jgi:hypothetical protein
MSAGEILDSLSGFQILRLLQSRCLETSLQVLGFFCLFVLVFEAGSHYIAQTSLELEILLSQPLQC